LQDHSPIADLINRVHHEERSLKIILDNLDVGIFTVNRGGLITFFNRAAEKISGFRREKVLGEPCHAIFESAQSPDVCLLKDSIASGKSRSTGLGKMMTIDGVALPIRATYMALRNEKGYIIGGLATFHDLTLVRRLNQAISDRYTFHDMIGKSPGMQQIFEKVSVVARTDTTVLIEGATGTGKDLLAKVIHSASLRAAKPLVKVNCTAIPENLLESELFGYVRGAFTGADRDKPGRFDLAHGGTIFLDEIGDMPLALQSKLLRVLEDREFYPLGSRKTRRVDVRILSATNRSLSRLVAEGLFRKDLFYRINVVQIELPGLADRREDLPLLIPHILRSLTAGRDRAVPVISEEAMGILLNYTYPGNVRELENILEHALIICGRDAIGPEHLPLAVTQQVEAASPTTAAAGPVVDVFQRQKIVDLLKAFKGNRARTAAALGIERTTLWRQMKRLGIAGRP
jgi:PAS domain S-box-containing protein